MFLLEYPERHRAPLKLTGLLMARLDDFLRDVCQARCVEAVTFGTRATDELVEEGDGLLTGVLTFILHHTGLEGNKWKSSH